MDIPGINYVIVPTFNEESNVESCVRKIFSANPDIRVLIVDGHSNDRTAEIVESLRRDNKHLSIIVEANKQGIGRAYSEAMRQLLTDKDIKTITTMDCDGSHDPAMIPELIKNCHIGNTDLVIGSRYKKGGKIEGWPWSRRLLSFLGCRLARFATGVPISDFTSGFVCYRADKIRKVDWNKINISGFAFQIGIKNYLVGSFGSTFLEIPIIFIDRQAGESKLRFAIIVEAVRVLCQIFFGRLVRRFRPKIALN